MRIPVVLLWLACCQAAAAFGQGADECWHLYQSGNESLWRFQPEEAGIKYYEALSLAEKLKDDQLYGLALFGIGQAAWYEGRFPDAVDSLKISLKHLRRTRAKGDVGSVLRILSNVYDDQGDYENAFKAVSEALEIYSSRKNDHNAALSLVQMGALYKSMGDYETARAYYQKAQELHLFVGEYPYRELNHRLGELSALEGNSDRARYYYRKALTGNPRSKIVRMRLGDLLVNEKKYDSAYLYYDSLYHQAQQPVDVNILTGCALGLARVYMHRQNYAEAIKMAQEALMYSASRGARHSKRDAYAILSAIYEAGGNAPLALLYLHKYTAIKDSVLTESLKQQLFAFRQGLEADKLKAERNRLLAGVAVFFALGILAFFIVSLRHKNEKLRLKQRASELEMRALRAQMNPHFIFNCLSSINHFVLNNETDKASEYLTRFARLIRMVLLNAGKVTITLEEELEMLRLYLNMEQLRFKEAFDYFIYFDEGIQSSMIQVPSFILQPFCENAIWHGLLHREGKGQLTLHFSTKKEQLICSIRDNGIGRRKAAELKATFIEKGASLGNRLSAERLALFNEDSSGASFVMEDIFNEKGEVAGTQVILTISLKHGTDESSNH